MKSIVRLSVPMIIGLLVTITAAQSGRIKDPPPTPAPVSPTTTTLAIPEMPKGKISALVVVGEISHDFAYLKTTSLDSALNDCVATLKKSPLPQTDVTRGGKMTYKDARERAKKETRTHVLWLGFTLKAYGISGMIVESVDYAVIVPGTAEILTRGRVDPTRHGVVSTGGVLNLPTGSRASASLQMRQAAQEVVYTLKRGGWF